MSVSAPKPPPKLPPSKPATPPKSSPNGNGKTFQLKRIAGTDCHRIVIYGTGGAGKSSLACLLGKLRGPIGFIDFDDSLSKLKQTMDMDALGVQAVEGVETWDDLRGVLHSDIFDTCKTIVIDTVTRAEELAVKWTLDNVTNDEGQRVNRIEGYGWGKGYQHVYDTFLALFGDFDQHIRKSRNVVLVAHEITSNVPNPAGPDFLRYEPRLQHLSSGKSSVRSKMKEWADHLFFLAYDIAVNKDGVAQGAGTRTIYCRELPWFMAKSRVLRDPIVFDEGSSEIWEKLFETVS